MNADARPTTRYEVWARVACDVVDLAHHAGIDVSSSDLFQDLPFDGVSIRRVRRVAWDDYCALVERVASRLGGLDALERSSEAGYHRTSPELTALARALIGAKPLYRLLYEVFNPILFPMNHFVYEDRGPTSIHVEAWLRPGVRPCLALHHGVRGAMRGLPRHLGLPPADVHGETAADHVSWDIELPASRSIASRVRRASRSLLARAGSASVVVGHDHDGTPVRVGLGPLPTDDGEAPLARATREWRLTPRQAEVLGVLSRGKSNKEIALALACAENTVELHVSHLLERAGARSRTELVARLFELSGR